MFVSALCIRLSTRLFSEFSGITATTVTVAWSGKIAGDGCLDSSLARTIFCLCMAHFILSSASSTVVGCRCATVSPASMFLTPWQKFRHTLFCCIFFLECAECLYGQRLHSVSPFVQILIGLLLGIAECHDRRLGPVDHPLGQILCPKTALHLGDEIPKGNVVLL